MKNGFHYAENPLDCLTYYSWNGSNEFWLVEGGGDLDEDGHDSKVTCTELRLIRRLSLRGFLVQAVLYILEHPTRKLHDRVRREEGVADNGWVMVAGAAPIAAGKKKGDLMVLLQLQGGELMDYRIFTVDDVKFMPGVFYGMDGEPRKRGEGA
ncbi:MAG: hypothetical protein IJ347_03190 [Faecalibacterium sp.]|nr:hypothetical protein [Faecalibacterium sp.]